MKTIYFFKHYIAIIALLLMGMNVFPDVITSSIAKNTNYGVKIIPVNPIITAFNGAVWQDIAIFPVSVSGTSTTIVFRTELNKLNYQWSASSNGSTPVILGGNTYEATVTWPSSTGQQTISVTYNFPGGGSGTTNVLINYYPFGAIIDAKKIPQFVEPVPHFAGGLRVDAKSGGALTVQAVPVKQIALSRGTIVKDSLGNFVAIGSSAKAGLGNYAGYKISKDGGTTYGPAMWPAQTIEAAQGHPLTVQYLNGMVGVNYMNFNILADQTLMENGYPLNGNKFVDPYRGPIPMVVHLHGGEMPSNSDGGPTAWFMPTGYTGPYAKGPGFNDEASSLCYYPNGQEGTTLWYHPHDQGLTRINVYTGLAGYYFLRGKDEDGMKLPGWTGDDKVLEVKPADLVNGNPRFAPFYPTTAYLPEVELAIQDRMFNEKGELYWPINPTNPEIHPFWTPEFFGDVMTVNGKSWPYLSVAPRKYMFRMLDGCNARFLNLWLEDMSGTTTPPKITVLSTEGGFLDKPVDLMQSNSPEGRQTLFIAPAERPMIVIDFKDVPNGTVFTLRNDAAAPYPTGDPVLEGLTDRIMQFVVNGNMVSAVDPLVKGTDMSLPTGYKRPTPLVKLTNFDGTNNVTPIKKRQILLNEVTGAGGPIMVAINNSHFDGVSPLQDNIYQFSGVQEVPTEGTIEEWQIMNTTTDAHPMHIHLSQWQLVKRQKFDKAGYMAAYAQAWKDSGKGFPNYPLSASYPGGAGSPNNYDIPNSDGALGGNPSLSTFLIPNTITYPRPEEMGWKDAIKALPGSDALGIGEVSTYLCRFAPTDIPADTKDPKKLIYPFDPSIGPGYVWHCHIIDHEDMDMMRPLTLLPNPVRFPVITSQPANLVACAGDNITFGVTATSAVPMLYQWQVSLNSEEWTNIVDGTPGPYSNSKTKTLALNPAAIGLNSNQYRCIISNQHVTPNGAIVPDINEQTISGVATLTVNNCTISGTLKYNNANQDLLAGMTVNANAKSALVDGSGNYMVTGVVSGVQNVTVTPGSNYSVGGINATDAGAVNKWSVQPTTIPYVKFLAGDVKGNGTLSPDDASNILSNFVKGQSFNRAPWSFWNAANTVSANPISNPSDPYKVTIAGQSVVLNLLGQVTGDFNGSLNPLAPKSASCWFDFSHKNSRKLGPNQTIDLPIIAGTSMQVGAVSLILNIPSDLVKVQDVLINGVNNNVSFNVKGNELRIGWYSLKPVSFQATSNFIILKLKTTSAFTNGKTITINIVANSLNEISDGSFKPIPQAVINVDNILNDNFNPDLVSLNCYPNPFRNSTTLSYTLPGDGLVSLVIYNMLGVPVKTLVIKMQQDGTYTVKLDDNGMKAGTFYATLRVLYDGKYVERTVKIVLNK